MKKCNYCETLHEDDVEKCCEFSDFTAIEEQKNVDEVKDNEDKKGEEELFVQPAAHELLVELVEVVELDEIIEEYNYPDWINEIQYDDVKLQAKNRWYDEHPSLITRIKKYLGL